MRTRIISALVGTALLIFALLLIDYWIFNVIIAIVSILALYEILVATKYLQNKLLAFLCFAFSGAFPFFRMAGSNIIRPAVLLFIVLLFSLLLVNHKTTRIEQVGFAFFVSFIIPYSLCCMIYIRDLFPVIDYPYFTMFYLILIFSAAWMSDIGAYFIGVLFGKHKLCPEISPKKTVEGAVGGILFAVVSFILTGLIFSSILGDSVKISFLTLLWLAPVSSIVGMFGDLTASVVKRQCSIKDFGNIMPGHGGVVDRLDSIMFVLPFIYTIITLCPVLKVV